MAHEAGDKAAEKTAQASVDSVAISATAQDAKREPAKGEAEKQAPRRGPVMEKMGHILFVYDVRGDVRVRFMDSSNSLIYQIPPLMLSRTMDLMQQTGHTVNTKA